MDKALIIAAVREHIGRAEIEEGLKELLIFLKANPEFKKAGREAVQLLSQYQKAQKDANLGIISYENAKLSFNQVTHQLLNLLEELENGSPPVVSTPWFRKLWPVLAMVVVAGAGFLLFKALSGPPPPEDDMAQQEEDCPEFQPESGFRILLLPFYDFGEASLLPQFAVAIKDRIGQLSEKHNRVITALGTYDLVLESPDSYPTNTAEAGKLGQNCRAQLIIWGTSEKEGSNAIVRTRYKFLQNGDQFDFKKVKITENAEIDTISSISSIATDGVLTENIEQSILYLFGIIAHEMGDHEAAIASLESIDSPVLDTSLTKNMVLADSYVSTKQTDKALKTYDKVLTVHPDYGFALYNRGALSLFKGNISQAIQDLSAKLADTPEDPEALYLRGSAYLESKQLDKAEKDLQEAESLSVDKAPIRSKLKEVSSEKQEQIEIKKEADQTLRNNPTDLKALTSRAESTKNLGDYEAAIASARAVIRQDPKNVKAYATLIEAYFHLDDRTRLKEILQKAKDEGIALDKLKDQAPLLKSILEDRTVTQ